MVTGPCDRCSEVHDRCNAHNRSGLPCRKYPTPGTTVCSFHGSKAPQVRRKKEMRDVEAFLLRRVKKHVAKNPRRHRL